MSPPGDATASARVHGGVTPKEAPCDQPVRHDFSWAGGPAALAASLAEVAVAADEGGLDTCGSTTTCCRPARVRRPTSATCWRRTRRSATSRARTARIRLGAMVSPATYREPAAAEGGHDLDVLSGGRAWLGLGVGYPVEAERDGRADATDGRALRAARPTCATSRSGWAAATRARSRDATTGSRERRIVPRRCSRAASRCCWAAWASAARCARRALRATPATCSTSRTAPTVRQRSRCCDALRGGGPRPGRGGDDDQRPAGARLGCRSRHRAPHGHAWLGHRARRVHHAGGADPASGADPGRRGGAGARPVVAGPGRSSDPLESLVDQGEALEGDLGAPGPEAGDRELRGPGVLEVVPRHRAALGVEQGDRHRPAGPAPGTGSRIQCSKVRSVVSPRVSVTSPGFIRPGSRDGRWRPGRRPRGPR